jgi:hypothetical protein
VARVQGEIVIERPAEVVFDYVADQRNEPTYNPRMLRSEKLTDGPVDVGSRFRAVVGSGRRPIDMLIEVTEHKRPTRFGTWAATKELAARGAPVVIVVRLVSATRRPTEHRAHHDRDGRPATAGPRRPARDGRPATAGPRQRARDERPMTYFRAAASHPPRTSGGEP